MHCTIQRKRAQHSPNQTAAIFQANIRHHGLVASMCYSRHHCCPSKLIGAHGTTQRPIQYFACLQEAAIADALAIHSATKFPHSKYCTVTKVQTTAPVSILNLLRGQVTNSIMNVIEWAIQIKTLENKLLPQIRPIRKVKGTHRTSSHDDRHHLSWLYINP